MRTQGKEKEINRYQREILSFLLKKYETSKTFKTGETSLQRPQFSMKRTDHPIALDYFDEMDFWKKEHIHTAVAELAAVGVIEIKWLKYREEEEIDKIFLQLQTLEEAYRLAGLIPKQEKIKSFRDLLAPLAYHPWDWVRAYWKYYDKALEENRTAGLVLDDLDSYKDLVKVLLYLAEQNDGVMKRSLSHFLFYDTKHFEQVVQPRLVAAVKRFGDLELDTDAEYLEMAGVIENPKQALVFGSFEFSCGSATVNAEVLPGETGLSSETIKQMEIKSIHADRVILIENLTTFHLLIQQRRSEPDGLLVIYTGGFPHHGLQKLFLKMQAFFIDDRLIPIFHWGDIDYGGILIFEHLKRNYFSALKPMFMNVETYDQYETKGINYTPEYEKKLKRLLEKEEYHIWHPLIDRMIEKGKKVEQESIALDGV